MWLRRAAVATVLLLSTAYVILLVQLRVPLTAAELAPIGRKSAQLTMRVNSFRRLDLLEFFLDYYKTCDTVKQIQVVWSDQQNKPPLGWVLKYPEGKVLFEVHAKDSLNNRFVALHDIPTDAVLSIDDDLILPCHLLQDTLQVWHSFDQALVGFSPRMLGFDTTTGSLRYLRWQHTWWSGLYTIMLTKLSFMHRDNLKAFQSLVPATFLAHIDKIRNCEDIAMAYAVAKASNAAPVWVDGVVYEVSETGISSGQTHFTDRSECVALLRALTNEWPWVTGKQKISRLHLLDLLSLWE